MRLPVLMYHNVGPSIEGTNPVLTVAPEEFRQQLDWLVRNDFRPVSAEQLCACFGPRHEPLPLNPVLITFDDGYAPLAEHAFPLLCERGLSAIVFLVTARLGQQSSWDAPRGFRPMPLLTADDVRSWHSQGIGFGGHTRTHADLKAISDAEVREEIAGCAEDLARLLGAPALAFAYPFGHYDDRSRAIAARHFPVSFTIETGINDERSDASLLQRMWVLPSHSLFDLRCQLRWGKSPIYGMRLRARRLFSR